MPSLSAEKARIWPQRYIAMLLAAAAFAGSFWLNTRHNSFPFGFHPDEPTKAEQILSPDGDRNFRHPQLMLECTQRALNWSKIPREMQPTIELGRRVSAVFGAVAVMAICLTGYLDGGLCGAFLLGLSAALCSPLVVYAHYFKEDAALAMGLGLVVLATRCMMGARSHIGAAMGVIFVGFACAVAASGKYAGAAFLIAGLAAVIFARAERWWHRITRAVVLLLGFAIFAAAINYRALINPSDFEDGFGFEAEHSVTSHFGLTMNRPNTYFLENLPREASWPIVLLGAAAIPILLFTWRRRNGWERLVILIGPGFLLILSFSIIPFTRYLLPVVLMMHVMAGLTALWIIQLRKNRRWQYTAGIIFTVLIVAIGLPRCVSVVHQFADDSRDRLRAWLIANLPPGTKVAGDFYTGMVVDATTMRGEAVIGNDIKVREAFAATSLGSITTIRSRGFSYLGVTDAAYERYFVRQIHPIPEYQERFDRQREFYVRLFADYPLVWKSDPDLNLHAFTNPAIRLYRIDGK